MTGYDVVCRTLETLGVGCVFGLPGSQNIPFFEALRRSNLRTVVPTSELSAAFMAIGFARASGKAGVLTTIPGPGFTYAVTGLAEARLDSVPLLHIVQRPASGPGSRFNLQSLDQQAIAASLVKGVFRPEVAGELSTTIRTAYDLAVHGEPGPVMVELAATMLEGETPEPANADVIEGGGPPLSPPRELRSAIALLRNARRPILLAGQGSASDEDWLRALAERLPSPVLTSTSGRGVLAEDHFLAVPSDLCQLDDVNALIAECDLVLALGIKFSHNGSRGFGLRIPPERLIHVDASQEVLGANYPGHLLIHGDVPHFISQVLDALEEQGSTASTWTPDEVAAWRRRVAVGRSGGVEPSVAGADPSTPAKFFALVGEALPRAACLVTDSGWHQMLVRRYFQVLAFRSLIVPTNLQSMGFGLPAAIGAKLAAPERPVVVVLGDGGFLMCGMELVTAVRHNLSLPIIVFNDGSYGLIRIQQLRDYGRTHGVDCSGLDLESVALASGARYVRVDRDIRAPLRAAVAASGPTLIEVMVGDSSGIHRLRAAGIVRRTAPRGLWQGVARWLRRLRAARRD